MQLEIPIDTVKYVCEIAKDKQIILDPAPANVEILDCLSENIFLIKPNETELNTLTQMHTNTLQEVIKASKKLLNKGVQNVLTSLGGRGSMLVNNEGYVFYPAQEIEVVDTTAAGDSFIASVALGIAEGNNLKDSIVFAIKVASITVSRQGAQSSIPSRDEIQD